MAPVTVCILDPALPGDAGPLARLLAAARDDLATRHTAAFRAAGADDVVLHRQPPDDTPFGDRLRRLVAGVRPPGGLVVLGAGAVPLARPADIRAFVAAAAEAPGATAGPHPYALANNRYSADAIAIPRAGAVLAGLPDLPTDNALPRWLEERAGVPVRDLGRRRHLAMDVDSPLDLALLERQGGRPTLRAVPPLPDEVRGPVHARLDALRRLARDAGAELLVAGRTGSRELHWLEAHTASRTRFVSEERGMKTAGAADAGHAGQPGLRPARSLLGTLLDRDGPGSLGTHVAAMADGALVDLRVLLAHRLGADERAWPPVEDRFAADLLLPERIADPWLAALAASAARAAVPILLGGHSLVGPGLRLALRGVA